MRLNDDESAVGGAGGTSALGSEGLSGDGAVPPVLVRDFHAGRVDQKDLN